MGFFQNLFGKSKNTDDTEEKKDEFDLEMDAEILSGDFKEEKPIAGTEFISNEDGDLPQTPLVDDELTKLE